MEENRKMLHEMIDGIANAGVMEYLATFFSLFLEKWGGGTVTETCRDREAQKGGAK